MGPGRKPRRPVISQRGSYRPQLMWQAKIKLSPDKDFLGISLLYVHVVRIAIYFVRSSDLTKGPTKKSDDT